MKDSKAYFRGCLLGGAIGDALGYSDVIQGKSLISHHTQMTVFTVDGLIWADNRAKRKGIYAYIPCIFFSYQKWYYTQTGHFADKAYEFLREGEILDREELFARRSPGDTALEALAGSINNKYGTLKNRINNSKGYVAAVRSAPIGLYFYNDPKTAFQLGCESGALTHGHSDGFLSAGFISYLMSLIIQGEELRTAVSEALVALKRHKNSETSYDAISKAFQLADSGENPEQAISHLGEGWIAEEAVAKAIYCALVYQDDFEKAIGFAIAQDGNRSGVASICGAILGGYLGSLEIPYSWIRDLELSDLMVYGADRLLEAVKTL
jgi:ADP-ribosylglycohydrolase